MPRRPTAAALFGFAFASFIACCTDLRTASPNVAVLTSGSGGRGPLELQALRNNQAEARAQIERGITDRSTYCNRPRQGISPQKVSLRLSCIVRGSLPWLVTRPKSALLMAREAGPLKITLFVTLKASAWKSSLMRSVIANCRITLKSSFQKPGEYRPNAPAPGVSP